MTLGERLRQLRIDRGWSQIDICPMVGAQSPATISHFETGMREPSVTTLVHYANAYNVSMLELIAPVDFGEKINEREPIPFD